MLQTNIDQGQYPLTRYFKQPRSLWRYKISPRSKIPPNWQRAQSFVKSLVETQIGRPPMFSRHTMREMYAYRRLYKAVRAEYQLEDFPINP